MRRQDGSEYWQGRFAIEMTRGAWRHGVTIKPHTTKEDAERDALMLALAKQQAL